MRAPHRGHHGAANGGRSMPEGNSAAPRGESKATAFISYSRRDSGFADRLGVALRARGCDPFVDRNDIYPFEDWWRRIKRLIARADTVVFVLSPDAVASPVCLREVDFAASLNKRFAPIVYRPVDADTVPETLRRLNFVRFDDAAEFEDKVDQLAEALSTDIEWIRQQTEFGDTARRWDEAGRKRGFLLRSPLLEQAEQWIATRPRDAPLPTQQTQALITESRHAATRWRNNLISVMAAGLIFAVGMGGFATWQWRTAVEATIRASRNFAVARSSVDELATGVAGNLRKVRGVTQEITLNILLPAEKILDRLVASSDENPDLLLSRIAILRAFANTFWFVGDIANARRYITRSLDLTDELTRSDPSSSRRLQALRERFDDLMVQGDILRVMGDVPPSFLQARDVAREIIRLEPTRNKLSWRELASALGRIGDVLRTAGRFAEAANEYDASERIQQSFLDETGTDEDWLIDLSQTHNRIGDNLLQISNHEGLMTVAAGPRPAFWDSPNATAALGHYEESVRLRSDLVTSKPMDNDRRRDYIWSLALLGMALLATDAERALKVLDQGLNEAMSLLATDQKNTEWLRYRALMHNFRGDALLLLDRRSEAFAEYDSGLSVRQKLADTDPNNARWMRDLAYTLGRMYELYHIVGDAELAERYRNLALDKGDQARQRFPADEVLAGVVARLRRAE